MKLAELDPHWLMLDGRRVGFIFRSPLKREWWQTCFVEPFQLFKDSDGAYRYNNLECRSDSQTGIVARSAAEVKGQFQGCKADCQWQIAGGIEAATFETMSVTPSLDGSAGGLWHGFITNGEIVGGM